MMCIFLFLFFIMHCIAAYHQGTLASEHEQVKEKDAGVELEDAMAGEQVLKTDGTSAMS